MEIMAYRVGDLDNPQEDDPRIVRYDEAEVLAQERSRYRDCAQGVWDLSDQDENGVFYTAAIAYRGDLYYA